MKKYLLIISVVLLVALAFIINSYNDMRSAMNAAVSAANQAKSISNSPAFQKLIDEASKTSQ